MTMLPFDQVYQNHLDLATGIKNLSEQTKVWKDYEITPGVVQQSSNNVLGVNSNGDIQPLSATVPLV